MIPAFSAAISSIVPPRTAVWSRPIDVTAATGASAALAASNRPPSPVSISAKSAPRRAKWRNAMAVMNSKYVGGPAPPEAISSAAGISSAARASASASPTGSPRNLIRSVNATRWGEV